MKRPMIIFLLFLFILSGCTNESNEGHVGGLTPQMIEVQLSTDPERIMPNEPVNMMAKVRLDGENVDDADEVNFEIWEDGHQDQSEKIEGNHDGDGVYSVSRTFEAAGVYYVVSHVTLREMHNMPRLKLVVGDVPGEESSSHEQEEHDQEMEHGEGH